MTSTNRRILITGGSGFIGTNYIEFLLKSVSGVVICNIDTLPPKISSHKAHWTHCDLQDAEQMILVFKRFEPTEVVHLAARTDTDSDDIKDYSGNIVGTENLINAIRNQLSVERLIITSTQFVIRPGVSPTDELHFDPHTAYGESKVRNEKGVRRAKLNCLWTIIRPTNIWGPWHPRYPYEFWRVLTKRLYFHPSGISAVRSYGYVDNVVFQIERILHSKESSINEKVFYVGDDSIQLIEWVNGFSLALTNRRVALLPRFIIQTLGWIGDGLKFFGIKFPITSLRFKSMTTDDIVPMSKTIEAFGTPPVSLEEGIRKSVAWMKNEGFTNKTYEQNNQTCNSKEP